MISNLFRLLDSAKEPVFPVSSVTFVRFYCGTIGSDPSCPVPEHKALELGICQDASLNRFVFSDIVRSAPADAYAFQVITANHLRGLFGHKMKMQPPTAPVWIGEVDPVAYELKTKTGERVSLSSSAHVYTPDGVRVLPQISEIGAATFAPYAAEQALRK